MSGEKEIFWINYIKAICMILVYLNHSEAYSGIKLDHLRNFYDPIFVNSFFLVSGYLLFRKQLSNIILLDIKSWFRGEGISLLRNILYKLAIPSVLFASLLYIPKNFVRNGAFEFTNFLKDTLLGGSMWFTSALTVAEIVVFLLLLTRCRSIWAYLVFGGCCAFASYMIYLSGFSLFNDSHVPWYYRSGLSSVLFLACGGVYWKYESLIDTFANKWKGLLFVVSIFVYICWGLFFYNYYSGSLFKPLNLPTIPIVLIGTYILIRISKFFPPYKVVNYMGRHSIGLYFLSGALPNTIVVLLKNAMSQTALFPLSVWVISLFVAFPTVVLINRYMPFMYDLRLLRKKI